MNLSDIKQGSRLVGVRSDGPVEIISVESGDGDVVNVVFRSADGELGQRLLSAEDVGKLFLPYYSTKGRGSGLGLAIVHRIVTDHNATIHVASNQPRGVVFTVEIPTH